MCRSFLSQSWLTVTLYPTPAPQIPGCWVNSCFYTRGNFLSLEVVVAKWLKMCFVVSPGISQWFAAAIEFLKSAFLFLNEAWRKLFQIWALRRLLRTYWRNIWESCWSWRQISGNIFTFKNKFGAHIIYQNGLYLSSPEKQMVTKQVL